MCTKRPDDTYSSESEFLEYSHKWIKYLESGREWVKCSIRNAYESSDGETVSVLVETPVGEITAFEFEVTPDKSAPYWDLIDAVAQGDPANLSETTNPVYLRHRSRSFHNLTVSEHEKRIRTASIDVNNEWELQTTVSEVRSGSSPEASVKWNPTIQSRI